MARTEPRAAAPSELLSDLLGEDLAALVAALHSGVASVAPVTSLNARNSRRASFRIALEDGTAIKGRRFETRFEAERFARLTRHLASPRVPAAIAQRGGAVIEPWIAGKSLAGQAVTLAEMRDCGALLASIHVTPPPTASEDELALARQERERRLAGNVDRLLMAGLIDESFAGRLRSAAGPQPARFAVGLIHGDFCPENLVRTEDDRILAVDNETLRFEALDYDLARCWYRWTMDGAQARAFLDGYGTQRSPADFLRHFAYWAICALVDSVVFRAGAGIAGVDAVLRRLKVFIEELPAFPADDGAGS
jgi:Ser/Thr protein kinase RdoA (MazF antagonist)